LEENVFGVFKLKFSIFQEKLKKPTKKFKSCSPIF